MEAGAKASRVAAEGHEAASDAGHLFDEKLLDNGFPSALADNDRRLKMFPRPSGTGNAVQQRGPIKLPMAGGLFQSILWA